MPWVRVDDHFPDHVKLAELGDLAPLGGWLYLCALAWCNRQLTDGRIPKAQVHRLASFRHVAVAGTQVDAEAIALELVRVGLWDDAGRAYQVHDYQDYQHSREYILAERQRNSRRRHSHVGRTVGTTSGTNDGTTNGRTSGVPSAPIPIPSTNTQSQIKNVTRAREGTAPLTAGLKAHRTHAVCGRVCLHASQFEELTRLSGKPPAEADAYVRQWALGVLASWPETQPIGDDAWAFWRLRWGEAHPSTRKAARQVQDDAEAQRWLAGGQS